MMAPLAFAVLATQVTGSYRLGGLMMAVFVAAEVIAAGPVGRLLDRIGVARGLRLLLVLCAVSLVALALVSAVPAVMVACVVVTGALGGGLAGGVRALLGSVVKPTSLERATSIDAVIVEIVVVGGPLVVALLTPFGGVVPVLGMAGSYLFAALLVPQVAVSRSRGGSWPRIGPWLFCAFGFGHLLSTIEVASLPLGQRVGGGPATAVLVVALLTGASVLGGICYAWWGPRLRLDRRVRAVLLLVGMAVGAVLVAFGWNWPMLAAGLVTVGVWTGPLNTAMSVHLQTTLPADRRAEGFGLVFTAQAAGFALGSLSVSVLPLTAAPLLGAFSALIAAACIAATPVAKPVTVEYPPR
ncbi:MFS transporter [Actinocrispum wychmicini]|uniref:MFS transporter n=2 Tax=Actinocrispum wychmicini TaxID=1213861 RepID=A0A4R2JWR3_9PSEU|nr:MFS transporter [Actinocrispum wychmicini]